jgi:hypothetical protein
VEYVLEEILMHVIYFVMDDIILNDELFVLIDVSKHFLNVEDLLIHQVNFEIFQNLVDQKIFSLLNYVNDR